MDSQDDRSDGRPRTPQQSAPPPDRRRDRRDTGPSQGDRDVPSDSRRWGYDPDEDLSARGIAQGERQVGGGQGSGRPVFHGGPDDGRTGQGRDDRHVRDDRDPPIDAEHGPGRSAHLAAGSGGSGDWEASGYSSGLRRGPGTGRSSGDEPYRPDPAFGPDAWAGDRSPQQRFGTAPARDAPPPGRGPKGWQRSDASVHDAVCERLARSSGLEVADVSVEVSAGHVTLSGTVADRPMKRAIEDRVMECAGVQDVDNRLKVMRPEAPRDQGPPKPRASVPQDSPTAREEARGRFSEPLPGAADKGG